MMELNINTQYEIGDKVKVDNELVGTITKIKVAISAPGNSRSIRNVVIIHKNYVVDIDGEHVEVEEDILEKIKSPFKEPIKKPRDWRSGGIW